MDGINGLSLDAWREAKNSPQVQLEMIFGSLLHLNGKMDRMISSCEVKHGEVNGRIGTIQDSVEAIENKDRRRKALLVGMGLAGGTGAGLSLREIIGRWFS